MDRIEWPFGMGPEAQVEAVAGGEADLAFDPAYSERLEDLFVRFPAQVYTSPQAGTLLRGARHPRAPLRQPSTCDGR